MQFYISEEFYKNYHPDFPVRRSHLTSGMRTRVHDLQHALKLPVITTLDAATEDLLIDPLAVAPRPEERETLAAAGWPPGAVKALQDRYAKEIEDYTDGHKFLACSEMEVFRWTGRLRAWVVANVSKVLSTCIYQKKLLETLGIPSEILPEPINSHFFYPSHKKSKSVIAIGSPTHPKNIEQVIKVYRALEGKGVHRMFVGGLLVWGPYEKHHRPELFKHNMARYHELRSVCDEFHEAAPLTFVARKLGESEFYMNFAYHEVGCRTLLEALMSGCGVIWGMHPLGEEYPVLCSTESVDVAVDTLLTHTGTLVPGELRKFAESRHSFPAVHTRFREIFYEN